MIKFSMKVSGRGIHSKKKVVISFAFWLVFFFLKAHLLSFNWAYAQLKGDQKEVFKDKPDLLATRIKEIYLEVKPAALVSSEGLREWQSFLGPDDDDSYQNDHLFIIIREKSDEITLWIQVTKFKTLDDQPRIKKAEGSKLIKAVLKNGGTLIEKNDFEPEESELILGEILKSIKKKKRLLGIKSF